ncbi:MAG: hypothetical protein KJZ69_03755 [Phycisphaerales bacterium]|nr:hypothetical protein [Phycisphaerales bacterium]
MWSSIAIVMSGLLSVGAALPVPPAPPVMHGPASAEVIAGASFDRIVGVARICGRGATGLCAGRNIDVGRVAYANNNTSLFVGYQTTGEWYIREVQLEVVADPSEFPMNANGSPKIGQFRFQETFETPTQEVIFHLSLSELGFEPGQTIYVAAHAVVVRIVGNEIVQEETAWGKGTRFGGGSWATFDDFRLGLCR